VVKARATGGSAPVKVLDIGTPAQADRWFKRFAKSVEADARARGLARNRWSKTDWVILGTGLALVLFLVALAFGVAHLGEGVSNSRDSHKSGRWDWFWVALFAWGFGMLLLQRMRAVRDTPAGRDACARWLGVRKFLRNDGTFGDAPPAAVTIWGRNLSYGVGLGVARSAAAALRFGGEDPHAAWSRYGGTWHQVRVEYPKRFGYGQKPLGVFAGGVVRCVFWGALAFAVLPTIITALWGIKSDVFKGHQPGLAYLFVALFVVVFGVMGAYLLAQLVDGLVRVGYGGSDLGKSVDVRGAVVRVGQDEPYSGYVAIDDGHSPETKAWKPPPSVPRVHRGDEVTVTYTPHLRHVTALQVAAAAPPVPESLAAVTNDSPAPTITPPSFAPPTPLQLDATEVGRLAGCTLTPVAPDAGKRASVPPGAAVQAFSDGGAGHVVVSRVSATASKMLAMVERRMPGEAVTLPGESEGGGDGVTAKWVRNQALVVEAGDAFTMVMVDLPGRTPEQRRDIAAAIAALALQHAH